MNILLDTQIAIWAISDDKKLKIKARELLQSPEHTFYYSAVSAVEVDLKNKSKKNNLSFGVDEFIELCHEAGYIPMPLKEEHIAEANRLEWNGDDDEHKDPFDRVLLAQAIVENMGFMTHDEKIPKFKQDCVILV